MINKSSLTKKIFLFIGMVLLIFIILLPILWMAFLSLRPEKRMFDVPWALPVEITFNNYKETFSIEFLRSISNSFIAGIGASVISVLLGSMAAFSLAKGKFRKKGFFMWLILLLRMAPPIGFSIPLFIFYIKARLIDTHIGLIGAYLTFTLPLVIWFMVMFYKEIPNELFEACKIDGATIFQSFSRIAFPLAKPGFFAATVLAFGNSWNDFFFSLVLTRSKAGTATVAVMNFLKYNEYDWGGIASACVIMIIPTIPIAFFMQKYMTQGITSGAVKG